MDKVFWFYCLCLLSLGFGISQVHCQDCTLPTVTLQYGLFTPPILNPATGSSVTFTCQSDGGETEFFWQRNGQTLSSTTSLSLQIAPVSAEDGGVYQCGVTACNDVTVPSTNQITVNTEPSITLLVGESSVMEGEMLSLSCIAQGWPDPTITWWLDGTMVFTGAHYTLVSITPAKQGEYECQASNTRGTASRSHTVTVDALPTTPGTMPSTTPQPTQDSTDTTAPTTQVDNSTGQSVNNDTMETVTASTLLEAPFIVILVATIVLAIGVLFVFIVMGCLCCTELRRAKARRPSDEIALLPTGSQSEGEEQVDSGGYGNVEPGVRSGPSAVNIGFKDEQATASDMSAQNSTDELPVQAQRYSSPNGHTSGLHIKRSKSPDKENLISLDDPSEEKKKLGKEEGKEGKKSQPKSEVFENKAVTSPLPEDEKTPALEEDKSTPPPPTEVPEELPIAAATQATPTVTAVSAGVERIIISERTGETTVTMETEEDASLDAEWESIPVEKTKPVAKDNGARASMITEKAQQLGRSASFVQELMKSHPLGVAEITDLVYNADHYVGIHPLLQEYKSVPSNSTKLLDLLPQEMDKNRYRNVLPNTHSRVPLKDLGEPGSTYINANYIKGYGDKEKAYIATQGPLFETMGDFWRMVWEQDVCVIVMITGIIERGMRKCAKYWPAAEETESTRYGFIAVKNNFEEGTSAGTVSYLTITNQDGQEREVYHFWCTTWPDFGVPTETGSILALQQTVNDYCTQSEGDRPLLVHCSAGLGRTGTFMAIDMGIRQFDREGRVDPLQYLGQMRQDRGGIIQTPEQYLFVHNALADYMATH